MLQQERKRLRHRLQYAAFLGLRAFAHRLSPALVTRLGRQFGSLACRLSAGDRRQTLANLELALPELDSSQRRALARGCFRELGIAIFDTLSAARLSPTDLLGRLTVVGSENLAAAEAAGKGVFLLGAHLGSFEVGAWILALTAAPLYVVSDELSNPYFDRALLQPREKFGLRTIPLHGAGRRMLKLLQAGGKVLVTLDQRPPAEEAIVARFFGQVSFTSPFPAYVALRLGVPAVPAFLERGDDGYRLELAPPVWPLGSGRRAVAELTQRYLDLIEERIRQKPEQWMWHYRRWRPEWDDPERIGSSLALRFEPPDTGQDEIPS